MKVEGVNVIIKEGTPIEYFDSILSGFPEWIQFKREIKLTTLLEGKKIEYRVEDILKEKPIFGLLEEVGDVFELGKIAFIIRGLIFKIKDGIVLELKTNIETLESESGVIVDSLINSEIQLNLVYRVSNRGEIPYFFVDFPKQTA